jgi:hypothetical protein
MDGLNREGYCCCVAVLDVGREHGDDDAGLITGWRAGRSLMTGVREERGDIVPRAMISLLTDNLPLSPISPHRTTRSLDAATTSKHFEHFT